MKPRFDDILDECLGRMKAGESGESLDSCLSDYPDQADLLKPLLLAANGVRSVPVPRARPQAAAAGKEQMLAEFKAQMISEKVHKSPISFGGSPRYTQRVAQFLRTILIGKEKSKMKLAVRIALDVLVILIIGSAMTMNAAARSLPGDPTYGAKRVWEQVRLSLTLNEQARQHFENQLAEERREEIRSLMQMGRQETVEFSGVLERIERDQWTVGGLAVQMAGSTTIEGTPTVGQVVRILAHVQNNGALLALHVGPEPHHDPQSGDPTLYPDQGASTTPHPTDSPTYPTQPAHTPDHTASPRHTGTDTPGTASEPTHTIEPTHHVVTEHPTEQPHEPALTHEPQHQSEPTRHVEPQHQPEPTHHEEPSHDSKPGHPGKPHDDGHH